MSHKIIALIAGLTLALPLAAARTFGAEGAAMGRSLADLEAEELVGRMLVASDGTPVGTVDGVVRDASGEDFLIVDTGALPGGLAPQVAIEADRARLDGPGRTITVGMTRQEILALPAYGE
jgi:hypothetical protein